MNRRDFSAQLLGTAAASMALGSFAPAALAQAGAPVEGTHFIRVEPAVPSTVPNKIEVLEFFSYGCPHCSAFEPSIEGWAKRLPADVAFQRVPVPFLANAENFMRTYYALETMGQVNALQRKVFAAIHVERQRLDKPADIVALVNANGVDGAKFLDVFNSFSVASSVTRAKKLAATYKLESVPAIAVQGRYLTSPAQAGGPEQALALTDILIQRVRKPG